MEEATHTFHTKAGLEVRVRPVCAEDAPLLVDLFAHLGPRSRFLRFQRHLDDPDPAEVLDGAEAIVTLAPSEGAAWVALADLPGQPDAPIAVARYRHLPPGEAEAAVSVRDDLHGTGIGTSLLLFVAQQAQAAGVRRLTALVRSENAQALGMLRHSPFPITQLPQGAYTYIEAELQANDEERRI